MPLIPRANANKIINKYCIKSPQQYSLEQILNAEGLFVQEDKLEGCIGTIVYSKNYGIVTVSSALNDETVKRFTIAHEFGHFCNEGTSTGFQSNNERVFKSCKYEDIMSIKTNITDEVNANAFAAELLMHEPWFKEKVKGKKLEVSLLKETAGYFNVSLTAASIRFAELDIYPCAVIMTTNGIVKWSCISKSFTHQFIRKGAKVSSLSYASDIYKLMQTNSSPNSAFSAQNSEHYTPEDVPAEAWFPESFYLKKYERVYEFNIPMKNYNSILTVVY